MSRRYEVVYIFDSALDEPTITQHLDRFHALLKDEANPEPIADVNHWGKRTLAYPIQSKTVGYYVVVQFTTDPKLLTEFERLVKLEDGVIRYQVIVNEGELPKAAPYPSADSDSRSDARPGQRGAAPDAAPESPAAPAAEAPAAAVATPAEPEATPVEAEAAPAEPATPPEAS